MDFSRLWIIIACAFSLDLSAQSYEILSFVDRYKEIAIDEMYRSGIPASIKLAQAILESDVGRSDLATEANNFFGMKCGGEWLGGTFYKKDDDRDRRGRLVPSCFRTYTNPEASFVAHSEFLLDERKEYRYGWLFELDPHDYKSWAWGLKESGYATNPKYAILLIKLIEEYALNTFDYFEPRSLLASAESAPPPPPKPTYKHTLLDRRSIQTTKYHRIPSDVASIDGIVSNNGKQMVYARRGDTPEMIAARYNKSIHVIVEFNEKVKSGQTLKHAERVYFERKRRSYKGDRKNHVVQPGETMYEIAQQYGIRLEKLYVRNRMYPGSEPAAGETVVLKGMIKNKNKPRLRATQSRNYAFRADGNHTSGKDVQTRKHIVATGDTLYGIANRYRVTVDLLRQKNHLDGSLIVPGQVLVVD